MTKETKQRERHDWKFYMRLPRRKREFALFMFVVSIISINVIAPLITFSDIGMASPEIWLNTLKILPVLWVAVIITVLATLKPAEWLKDKIVHPGDSFNAHILANIVCSVFLMSIILTIVGTGIGTGIWDGDLFTHFFLRWPRNFGISFGVEALVAQPIARLILHHYHLHIDKNGMEVED
ncbi:MAG: hypothetical protein LBN08_02745 [Lactobacillales bacterium]|jgi:hypothetical protein|nr:hypothetical protein [Lactobacillales bacterium]